MVLYYDSRGRGTNLLYCGFFIVSESEAKIAVHLEQEK